MANYTSISQPMQNKPYIFWQILGYFPWVWLIALALFKIGTFNQPSDFSSQTSPTPGFLANALDFLDDFTVLGLLMLFITIPLWSILGIILKRTNREHIQQRSFLLPLLGILFWALYLLVPALEALFFAM